jgi:hypothetical protein
MPSIAKLLTRKQAAARLCGGRQTVAPEIGASRAAMKCRFAHINCVPDAQLAAADRLCAPVWAESGNWPFTSGEVW